MPHRTLEHRYTDTEAGAHTEKPDFLTPGGRGRALSDVLLPLSYLECLSDAPRHLNSAVHPQGPSSRPLFAQTASGDSVKAWSSHQVIEGRPPCARNPTVDSTYCWNLPYPWLILSGPLSLTPVWSRGSSQYYFDFAVPGKAQTILPLSKASNSKTINWALPTPRLPARAECILVPYSCWSAESAHT